MLYRRFGKTNLQLPVFTCGGMRFQQSWNDADPVTPQCQSNLRDCVERALELGINHIETARGYGTSEEQLGEILPNMRRSELIVQTKVGPDADPQKFREGFERSMSLLKLDYVDLLALHGLNNMDRVEQAIRDGGCLDAALELKKAGRVRHVGFSTHGDLRSILAAVGDGRFEFVNLHWYYVNPFNWPAIELATKLDMGVFIISPNDKGGKLYQPSPKLQRLTAPLSPMIFNNLWCLSRPQVHTLSVGVSRPGDFDEHIAALEYLKPGVNVQDLIKPIEERLHAEMITTFGRDWAERWHEGLPEWHDVPGGVNVWEILRLRNFAMALDMVEFGKMRYNLLGNADHWFPGNNADKLGSLDLREALKHSPFAAQIPAALAEAHALLSGQDVKRLGSH